MASLAAYLAIVMAADSVGEPGAAATGLSSSSFLFGFLSPTYSWSEEIETI
jgi:hypothetical protein